MIMTKYLASEKCGITDSNNHKFGETRNDWYYSLPIEKMLIFYNVITLMKPAVNKNKNECYLNIFLEKGSYKDKWMFAFYKCYILIELTFLKELMLIKEVHQKSATFASIGFS